MPNYAKNTGMVRYESAPAINFLNDFLDANYMMGKNPDPQMRLQQHRNFNAMTSTGKQMPIDYGSDAGMVGTGGQMTNSGFSSRNQKAGMGYGYEQPGMISAGGQINSYQLPVGRNMMYRNYDTN